MHIERVDVFTESERDPAEKESDECEDDQKYRYGDCPDTLVQPRQGADDLSCLSVYEDRVWLAVVLEREEPYGHHHIERIIMDIDVIDRINDFDVFYTQVDRLYDCFGIERMTSVCS